jgi:hypothetical protein
MDAELRSPRCRARRPWRPALDTAQPTARRPCAAQIAAALGFDSIDSYISNRRAAGWTWQAMSAESGQPPSWLRLHQTQSSPQARASPRSDSR